MRFLRILISNLFRASFSMSRAETFTSSASRKFSVNFT
eukprot:UN06607